MEHPRGLVSFGDSMINVDSAANASATTSATTDVIAAPSGGKSIVLTSLVITNATASTDYVEIYAGSTLLLARVAVAAASTRDIPCGRGILISPSTAVRFKAITGGSTIYVSATYTLR